MRLPLEVLRTVEFLADGSEEEMAEFLALGRTRAFARNHVLWRAGQRPEWVVIPLTGELASLGRDAGGRGICYSFYGTGECAGVPAAVDGLPEPREIRVIRGGEFLVVDRPAFLRFLDAHPDARGRVRAMLGRRLRRALDERDRDVFLPVHARVARFLLEHACVRRSDGARVLMRESQPEIAIRLGSVREVVAREMAAFAAHGLLRRTRHALFVVDWAGLRAKAELMPDEEPAGDAETASLRTRRFFLPVLDAGPARVAEEADVCGEHLTGFRACVARGCPLAVAACGGAASAHGDASCRGRQVAAEPAARLHHGRDDGTHAAPRRPGAHATDASSHGANGPDPVDRCRVADEAGTRTPFEEAEIRRRIATYRQRVAGIESRFGGDERVPADLTVFSDR